MAKYTIELRRVCDIYGRNTVEQWFKDYDIKKNGNKEETKNEFLKINLYQIKKFPKVET